MENSSLRSKDNGPKEVMVRIKEEFDPELAEIKCEMDSPNVAHSVVKNEHFEVEFDENHEGQHSVIEVKEEVTSLEEDDNDVIMKLEHDPLDVTNGSQIGHFKTDDGSRNPKVSYAAKNIEAVSTLQYESAPNLLDSSVTRLEEDNTSIVPKVLILNCSQANIASGHSVLQTNNSPSDTSNLNSSQANIASGHCVQTNITPSGSTNLSANRKRNILDTATCVHLKKTKNNARRDLIQKKIASKEEEVRIKSEIYEIEKRIRTKEVEIEERKMKIIEHELKMKQYELQCNVKIREMECRIRHLKSKMKLKW